MKMLRTFGLVFAAALVVVVGSLWAQATRQHAELTIDRNKITDRTYQVTYRNAANRDTTKRLFTGAAALPDTSVEVFWIGGASTISMQSKFTIREDSALVHQYL